METLGINGGYYLAQLINVAIVVFILYVIYRVIYSLFKKRPSQPQALETLNQRLVKGEISEGEYYRLRLTIESVPNKPKRDAIQHLSDDGELVEDSLLTI